MTEQRLETIANWFRNGADGTARNLALELIAEMAHQTIDEMKDLEGEV